MVLAQNSVNAGKPAHFQWLRLQVERVLSGLRGTRIYVARRLPLASHPMTPLKDGAVPSPRLRSSAPATPRRMRRGHFPLKANSKLHIDRPCQLPGFRVARTAPGFRLRAAQRLLIVEMIRVFLGAAPFGGSITDSRSSLMLNDDRISRFSFRQKPVIVEERRPSTSARRIARFESRLMYAVTISSKLATVAQVKRERDKAARSVCEIPRNGH